MTTRSSDEITRILALAADGDRAASDQLLPLVYEELRALAGSFFRGRRADHTLQPTALVHEVYLRIAEGGGVRVNDRAHFFNIAAQAMRQLLTDHARRRRAEKRGGGWRKISFDEAAMTPAGEPVDLVALDDALTTLAGLHARQARVTELRLLAGLSIDETAEVVGVSPRTVDTDWRMARAWLQATLADEAPR